LKIARLNRRRLENVKQKSTKIIARASGYSLFWFLENRKNDSHASRVYHAVAKKKIKLVGQKEKESLTQ